MQNYLLTLIIFSPLIGALLLMFLPRENKQLIKMASLVASFVPLVFTILLMLQFDYANAGTIQFTESHLWIPGLEAYYKLGIDGLSLPLVVLTVAIMPLCIIYSFRIEERVKEYHVLFHLLAVGMLGTFLALDFFLFYVFWEVGLVPMYFIIGIWGGTNRNYAAIKFFLYTLAGSVFLLLTIVAMRLSYGTFDVIALAERLPFHNTPYELLAWFGLFLAFAIKVPMFPFHTWLPDAHTEAPTAGSVVLAAVLLKLGGYAMIRMTLPIMPYASHKMAPWLMLLGVIGVIYGAFVAMAQWDFKRLIAYTSVNHMGYMMMGIAAAAAAIPVGLTPGTEAYNALLGFKNIALAGAVWQMVTHGVVTGALFFLVGVVYDGMTHNRDLAQFGGLGQVVPKYQFYLTIGIMASLGLPGLAGFVSEFMCFLGAWNVFPLMTGLAVIGLVVTAALFLWTIQRVLLGDLNPKWKDIRDMDAREKWALAPLVAAMVVLGVYPPFALNPVMRATEVVVQRVAAPGPGVAPAEGPVTPAAMESEEVAVP